MADGQSTLRGDGPCQQCGTLDIVTWFAPSVFWNAVVRNHPESPYYESDAILCIPCFVALAEEVGFRPTSWQLTPEWPWRAAAVGVLSEGPEQ